MLRGILFFAILAFITETLFSQSMNAVKIYEKSVNAVVYIEAENSIGTGFIVNNDGWIVTNKHVISNDDDETFSKDILKVKFLNGNEYKVTRIIEVPAGEDLDIALIKINTSTYDILPILDTDDAKIGEDIVAIGHPRGLAWTQTKGSVTNFSFGKYVQIDVAVNPGNSGGPIINSMGYVIGVVTAGMDKMQNTNIGIKASILRNILNRYNIKYSSQPLLSKEEMEAEVKTTADEEKKVAEIRLEYIKKQKDREDELSKMKYEKEKELIQRQKEIDEAFQNLILDSLNAKVPKRFVLGIGGGAGFFEGQIDGMKQAENSLSWNSSFMFGFRFETNSTDQRGHILAAFMKFGGANKEFRYSAVKDGEVALDFKEYSGKIISDDDGFNSNYEMEVGVIFGEWFRLSGGIGSQSNNFEVMHPITKNKETTNKSFGYYTGTLGIVMRFGVVHISSNFTAMMGRDVIKTTTKADFSIAVWLDFFKARL